MIKKNQQCLSVLLLCYCIALSSNANAAQRIYSPYVTSGELELEYFGSRSFDSNDTKDNEQKQQIAIGYGVNEWWKTEFYSKFKKGSQDSTRFDKWEWENIFQLTERGEYLVDVGASIAYEWTPQSNRADTVEGRILLAKDLQGTSHILNIVAEKNVGAGPKEKLKGKLLWSSLYNYTKYFNPGFEIESDFGELKGTGSLDNQKHYVGPAGYGKIPLGITKHADALKYRVGYLFGISDAAQNGQVIAQIEYELHF